MADDRHRRVHRRRGVDGAARALRRGALRCAARRLRGAARDALRRARRLGGDHAGDGHLLAFGSVRAALALRGRPAARAAPGELPFRVRAGVHSGELERHDGELRGRALVKAARICALARGGEILASRSCATLADLDAAEGDLWFDDEAEVELRGLRGRHVVVPVRWHERERPPGARRDRRRRGDRPRRRRRAAARERLRGGGDGVATPRRCTTRSSATGPTSRSSTSGCRRRTPTRAWWRPSGSARASRRPACSCSPSTSSPSTRCACCATARRGGYCSRTGSPTSRCSSTRSAASRAAAAWSIPG